MDTEWLQAANEAVDRFEDRVKVGDELARGSQSLAGTGRPLLNGLLELPAPYCEPFRKMGAHPVVEHRLNWRGASGGRMGEAQLAEIGRIAEARPEQPMFVLGHHHPDYERPDFLLPEIGLDDTAEFVQLLDQLPNVLGYIHGHTHSWQLSRTSAGKHLINLPPVAFVFEFAPDRPLGWVSAELDSATLKLELRTLDSSHDENGQQIEMGLRSRL